MADDGYGTPKDCSDYPTDKCPKCGDPGGLCAAHGLEKECLRRQLAQAQAENERLVGLIESQGREHDAAACQLGTLCPWCRITELETQLAQAKAELQDWRGAASRAAGETCGDERHCVCVPVLRQLLIQADTENARLQAIVDAGYKTADGAPVARGMVLWLAPFEEIEEDGTLYRGDARHHWAGAAHPFIIHGGRDEHSHAGPVDLRDCYSTREAAEAAKEKP